MNSQKTDSGNKFPYSTILIGIILLSALFKIALLYDFNYLPLIGDEYRYWRKAINSVYYYFDHLDYQGPLYPIFLGLNRILFGDNALLIVRIEQILLHSLEIYLLYLLARFYFSEKSAFFSGIIASIYLELFSYSYLLFSEILFLLFFLSSVFFYFLALKKTGFAGLKSIIASGILFGLSCLVRSVNFLFFPLILLHLLVFKKDRLKNRLIFSAVFALAMFAPISIQTAKNYRIAHCPLLIDTCADTNFYRSHNLGMPPHYDFREYRGPQKFSRKGCVEQNICLRIRCELNNAMKFVLANPRVSIYRAGIKIIDLYTPNLYIYRNIFREDPYPLITEEQPGERAHLDKYKGKWFRIFGSGGYLILMLLAMLGLFSVKEWELRSLTLALILYHTAVGAVFFTVSRYRIPFIPFLIIYAGAFLGMKRSELKDLKKWKWLTALMLWLLLFILTFPRLQSILR